MLEKKDKKVDKIETRVGSLWRKYFLEIASIQGLDPEDAESILKSIEETCLSNNDSFVVLNNGIALTSVTNPLEDNNERHVSLVWILKPHSPGNVGAVKVRNDNSICYPRYGFSFVFRDGGYGIYLHKASWDGWRNISGKEALKFLNLYETISEAELGKDAVVNYIFPKRAEDVFNDITCH